MINEENTQTMQVMSPKPGGFRPYNSAFVGAPNVIHLDRGKCYLIGVDQDLYWELLTDAALFDATHAQVLFGRTTMAIGAEHAAELVVQARTADTDVRITEIG